MLPGPIQHVKRFFRHPVRHFPRQAGRGSAIIQVYRYKDGDVCRCAVPTTAIIATFGSIAQFEAFFGGGTTTDSLPTRSVWACGDAAIRHGFAV